MLKKFPFLVKIASLTTVLIVSFGLSYAYAAWTAPTQAPPGANIAVPLNTGPVAQNKTGTLEFSNNIGTRGFSPTSGLPTGWGGGVHTWDVYAEGTIGVGKGGSLKAYLSDAGDIYASGNITAKGLCLGGVCRTSWPTATVVPLPGPINFGFTGAPQSYTVNSTSIKSLKIEAWGAQGGSSTGTPGGYGGYAQGVLAVSFGERITIYVGGTGRYNGGGWGGGSRGGGASDVRVGGSGLYNRVIVAAGGGGGHYGNGGSGGGLTGGSGNAGGGTQSGGGTPGGSGGGGYGNTTGTFGAGGGWSNGSGGGGGWYGGGGAYNGAGGGSSYIGKVSAGVTKTGQNRGNGRITIIPQR